MILRLPQLDLTEVGDDGGKAAPETVLCGVVGVSVALCVSVSLGVVVVNGWTRGLFGPLASSIMLVGMGISSKKRFKRKLPSCSQPERQQLSMAIAIVVRIART